MGLVGAIVTLPGLLSYLAGRLLQTVLGFATQEIGILYAAGALLVGLYFAAMILVQIVFFFGPGGAPSSLLLAF